MLHHQLKFVLLAILAEAFIIYASVLVKIIEVPPIMLGFYRMIFAIPLFLFFALKDLKKIKLSDALLMILAGIFFGLDLIFFNTALHHTSVTHVNLFASLVCFVLVPIGVIFFRESIKLGFIIGSIMAVFGIYVLVGWKHEDQNFSLYGDFLAFLSMCCYSFFLALIYKMRKQYNTMLLMFFASIGSSILLLVIGLGMEGWVVPLHTKDWILLFLIVLFGQILGQGFFGYIMGKLDTQSSSLILLFSPIIAAILGYICLGETIGLIEWVGIAIILFGVYMAKK